jgi:protein tyrosine phosphatase (PTP) superfamily phosphohydrolase (DUF442 family)
MRGIRVRRWTLRTVAALLVPVLGLVGWDLATSNFGTVQDGRVFRSGQMTAGTLASTIRREGIKTVLNLRGSNPDQPWYRAERAATLAEGATQVDMSLASDLWLSRAQARTLVRMLDASEYPILIHCEWGSERTGLASAMAELLRPGGSLADARRQFSWRYLFVPMGDGAVTRDHLDRYEQWLRARGLSHTPERFRLWVAEGYRPGHPSREDWPYDPKPLVVVTRPVGSGEGGVGSGE